MITVIGKDKKAVSIIRSHKSNTGYYVYILSDFIECDGDDTGNKIGWFYLCKKNLKKGTYLLGVVDDEWANFYKLVCDEKIVMIDRISGYNAHNKKYDDTKVECYKDIMKMHREFTEDIVEKTMKIKELEADLELVKSELEHAKAYGML